MRSPRGSSSSRESLRDEEIPEGDDERDSLESGEEEASEASSSESREALRLLLPDRVPAAGNGSWDITGEVAICDPIENSFEKLFIYLVVTLFGALFVCSPIQIRRLSRRGRGYGLWWAAERATGREVLAGGVSE